MEYGIHTLVKDYLGSIRLVKNSTGTVEEINNYYPSGALFTVPVPDVQDYKYSGKQLVDYADLGWYDYGARYYDPVLMRWHSADPLLEKYYRHRHMHSVQTILLTLLIRMEDISLLIANMSGMTTSEE